MLPLHLHGAWMQRQVAFLQVIKHLLSAYHVQGMWRRQLSPTDT